MPTTRPRLSASAPPELPGLSAASVWITLSMMRAARRERAGSERPSAETTPAVTEPAKPVRVADRDHELADAQPFGVAELGGGEAVALGAQHRQVGERVAADDLEAQLAAVGEGGPAAAAPEPADDVRGGEQEAVGREHDAAAGAGGHLAAAACGA